MADKSQIIACENCGTKNRISLENKDKAICGKCKEKLYFPTKPIEITGANFNLMVEKSTLPVLVDFWATWCPPCRMIAPILDEVARELSGKAMIGKLDVDANQITAGRFRVQSIPTLLIFKGGKQVERIVGLQTKEAILQKLKKHL